MKSKKKVLVACEESQAVCKAFRAKGHEAYSCDIQECSGGHPEWHLQMDAFEAIKLMKWDTLIAFPPCTYLSSVQTFLCRKDPNRVLERIKAAEFFMKFITCDINEIAVENPTGVMSEIYRKPDQIIHPYYFGDTVMKRTCLWLKGLPKLKHNKENNLFEMSTYGQVPPPVKTWVNKNGKTKYQRQVNEPFLSGKQRSKLSPFIAQAMAEQWG
jgi:hypothetical protein